MLAVRSEWRGVNDNITTGNVEWEWRKILATGALFVYEKFTLRM